MTLDNLLFEFETEMGKIPVYGIKVITDEKDTKEAFIGENDRKSGTQKVYESGDRIEQTKVDFTRLLPTRQTYPAILHLKNPYSRNEEREVMVRQSVGNVAYSEDGQKEEFVPNVDCNLVMYMAKGDHSIVGLMVKHGKEDSDFASIGSREGNTTITIKTQEEYSEKLARIISKDTDSFLEKVSEQDPTVDYSSIPRHLKRATNALYVPQPA